MKNINLVEAIINLNNSSVKEVETKMGLSDGSLRKAFKKALLPCPSYFINLSAEDFSINEEQKKNISYLYENYFGKSKTIKEISLELSLSEKKIKQFLKDNKITHSSFFKDINSLENVDNLENEIQNLIELKIKKKLEDKKVQETKKNSESWVNWKVSFLDEFVNSVKNLQHKKVSFKEIKKTEQAKFCAVLPLQDFHWGKFSTYNEVGKNENNYDLLKKRLEFTTNKFLNQLKNIGTCEVLYLTVGGDFFNIDTWNNTTTSGTPQDNQSSLSDMLLSGLMLMVSYINYIIESGMFKQVFLVPTPGNHDKIQSISLYTMLNLYFMNNSLIESDFKNVFQNHKVSLNVLDFKDISDNLNVQARQYVKYGNNLLVFHHGDGAKAEEMPVLIAQEARKFWGDTKYCAFFNGHYHTKFSKELNGVIQFQSSSLSGSDRWHYNKGYTTANKALNLFLFDKESGFFCELYNSVDF
jgi:hypothetical protein